MFQNEKLQEHLETSSSIKSQPYVVAEWNMNIADNIATIGNYRYRPNADPAGDDGVFLLINDQYDANDATNEVKFYTDATYADTVVDGGLDNNDQPIAFVTDNEKERLLYSLEDCFQRFRPRSGINKLRYFENKFTHHTNKDMAKRPRYYMASRNDAFKYWTSYRQENGIERGIATELFGLDQYYIHDAAPFIVYKEEIPVNKIVVKMQTHVGDVDLGPFQNGSSNLDDPFFGEGNRQTPVRWKIQYLKENSWIDAIAFDESSVRSDNSAIIKHDGYVEISYGVVIPQEYRGNFYFAGSYTSASLLPESPINGSAYLVGSSDNSLGLFYIWTGTQYETFVPNYDWSLSEESIDGNTQLVNALVGPEQYPNPLSGVQDYREIQYIRGIRVVVETMDTQNSTFDLIEISPRLSVNLTDKVQSFSLTKNASDLGVSGMPVGQLLASTGSLDIFDYDQSFNSKNTNSIIADYLRVNLQVKLYEVINFVENNELYEYYVPIKTMYSDSFPEVSSESRSVVLEMRDLFFYFESTLAPQILIENSSLSYAISLLLDSVGFSNYAFLRVDEEDDPIIPYFFVAPDQSIAQILEQLAISTQSAMFFDEYNNFIVMSKNYIMPTDQQRATDLTLKGSLDQTKENQLENKSTSTKLSNIIEMTSSENKIFNAGSINYTSRYIQKTYGSLKQASIIDRDKTWIYKPVLLWEVSGEELVRSRSEEAENSSAYTLSAIPLNSDLVAETPSVLNGEIINNVIDLGEGVYWLARYNGYFYANGEIIKFDAVEYNVSGLGNVWVTSTRDYQNYFAQIGFNGKIYPTGRVKIYAEPNYEEVGGITVLSNGEVAKHGRGQFGTPVVEHNAGLNEYWSDNTATAPVNGVEMDSSYLFFDTLETSISSVYNEGTNKGKVVIEVDNDDGSAVFRTSLDHNLQPLDYIKFFTNGSLPSGLNTETTYYVTYSQIGDRTFTVAETINQARSGNTISVTDDQSGEHSVALEVIPDIIKIQDIANSPGAPVQITTQSSHALAAGDRIFLEVRDSSNNEQSNKNLPSGLSRHSEYYVKEVIDSEKFTVSETLQGNVFLSNGYAGEITELYDSYICKNVTRPTLDSTIYASSISNINPGDLVELVGGAGQLFAETRVSATRSTAQQSFSIEGFVFDEQYTIFQSTGHKLFTGDIVKVSTTGILPSGISTNLNYYVQKINENSFVLTFSNQSGYLIAEDTEISGNHSVTKKWGKFEKIILSSAASTPLPKTNEQEFTTNTVVGSIPELLYTNNSIKVTNLPAVTNSGAAGVSAENFELARSSSRNGIIKNLLAKTSFSESDVNKFYSTQAGTIQSSALVMTGPSFRTEIGEQQEKNPLEFVSYVHKPLNEKFTHFGTRMRIVGRLTAEDRLQTAFNSINYYQTLTENPNDLLSFSGSSGGLALMLNPETNIGYYFEIVALSESNVEEYADSGIYNVLFYKLTRRASTEGEGQVLDSTKAIPVRLFAGSTSITVDDGTLVGQFRMTNESNPSVYDLSVEYEEVDNNTRRFYLYINNRVLGVVDDPNPLPVYNNMALFVRGEAKAMFENIYAIANNYSQNTVATLDTPVNSVFGANSIDVSESFRKYSMSGLVQSTYLSGIGTSDSPKHKIYFEEFGTIMREAAYFNIRYDKAYPALYAQLSPTFNKIKGYTVSGFVPNAYGAEFLVFNHTDTALNLDETSGNYLRIQGVTFTQQSDNQLTVDNYFENISNFSTPEYKEDGTIISPVRSKKEYQDIKNSRVTNGRFEFTLQSPYIQSQDAANDLMAWIISKVSKQRKAIGLTVFGLPVIQLGDIVSIDYLTNDGVNQISINDSRFVVYSIAYGRDSSGPKQTIYLSEVL